MREWAFIPFMWKWYDLLEMKCTLLFLNTRRKKIWFYWILIYQNSCKGLFTNNSGVNVLLVILFGIPIVRSISHFLVDQKTIWSTKKKLVCQKKIWHTKKKFGQPKKEFGRQKNETLTGQLVYQRDWPKVHGRCLYWQDFANQWPPTHFLLTFV